MQIYQLVLLLLFCKTTDALNQNETYEYDDYGNPLSKTDRNGTVTTYTLRVYGVVQEKAEGRGETESISYVYDKLGRISQQRKYENEEMKDEISYTYDGFGRKITETNGGITKQYEYDAASNVSKMTLTENGVQKSEVNYTYDANNVGLSMICYKILQKISPSLRKALI